MPHLQLSLTTTPEKAPLYANTLSETGALAVTFLDAKDDPIFEPEPGTTPLWTHTQIVGLYALDVDISAIEAEIQKQLGPTALKTLSIELLGDQAWERVCMDQFHPMKFGTHLWICPSWESMPELKASDTTLLLDPGLAFGTGTHPTTRLCLEWLDAHPPIGKAVIDYGCGSGILGIAALKLGATQVYAVDHEQDALISTRLNAQKNGYGGDCISTELPQDFKQNHGSIEGQIDLILANILATPLITLAASFAEWLKPAQGQLVLAGILNTQVDELLKAYDPWFQDAKITSLDEWSCIYFLRRNA